MLGRDEIDRRFGFHPATAETIPLFEDNRARVVDLAARWDETLPDGREKALALTALQEAVMWANAAVACNLSPLGDPAGRLPPRRMTTRIRLCDDAGMVSDRPVDRVLFSGGEGLTYRGLLNNLRSASGLPPYEGEPFPCTGAAHLAGQVFHCTSPAHGPVIDLSGPPPGPPSPPRPANDRPYA